MILRINSQYYLFQEGVEYAVTHSRFLSVIRRSVSRRFPSCVTRARVTVISGVLCVTRCRPAPFFLPRRYADSWRNLHLVALPSPGQIQRQPSWRIVVDIGLLGFLIGNISGLIGASGGI